jgi:hypothetical protein
MGPSGPEAFTVSDIELTLHLRGYHDSEYMTNLLLSMDVIYRIWWHEEHKDG